MSLKILLFLIALLPRPSMAEAPSIEGHWIFYKKIYLGQEIPEHPGATLRMHFEFSAAGESLLYWWHEGEDDLCRRRGEYSVEDGYLLERVTWVDPENAPHCSRDPDMQPGNSTRTPFYFHGRDLAIRFHLGNEPLDLVWKKIEGGEQ